MKVTVAGLLARLLEGILEALYEKLRKSMSNRVAAAIDTQGYYRRYCNVILFDGLSPYADISINC